MSANEVAANNQANATDPVTKEMIAAGVFYGRKKSKTHPRMRQFVLANRGGIDIINLAKSAEGMEQAVKFMEEKAKAGALVLAVGTQAAAAGAVLNFAKKFDFPYVVNRWLGGTMTNFKMISKRVEQFKTMRNDLKSGAYNEKYTKKERLDMEKLTGKLDVLMGGLENLAKAPDMLIVVDPVVHNAAVREARRLKIPVIALANVDSDPDLVDYIVPGNDQSKTSIDWFFGKLEAAIEKGRKERAAMQALEAEKAKEEQGEAKKAA